MNQTECCEHEWYTDSNKHANSHLGMIEAKAACLMQRNQHFGQKLLVLNL